MIKFSTALELKKLVTFIPNKKEPIHNWYHFKEGFSKKLVDLTLEKFNLKKGSVVIDPFCGSGTTPLACKQNGYESMGFDVSPFFVFVSKVKTDDYDLDELKEAIIKMSGWKYEKPRKLPKEKFITRVFPKYTLEKVIFYRDKILEIENEKIRNFLFLALVDSSIKSSWTSKDGSMVRIDKRGKPPLKKYFKYKVKKMLKDLKKTNIKPIKTKIEIGDARDLQLEDESVDCVITSPPYLNQIKYTKIYAIETSLFFDFPKTNLKSFLGTKVEDRKVSDLGLDENLPLIAKSYFVDMNKVLKEMYRVCRDKSKLSIVIGGGCFPNSVVESDKITAELAEKIGFDVEVFIARNSWCTKKRTIKVGRVRESVIILNK
jgi:tRNA G10  N-methylase Trm11